MSTAALQHHRSSILLSDSPALRLLPTPVPPGPAGPVRPALRVIEGGRAPARLARRATYVRRWALVLALAATAILVLVLLVGAISTRLAGGGDPSTAGVPSPTSAAASSAAEVAAPAGYRIVQPGDTLWTIAADIAPGTDVRRTVEALVEVNGHDRLTVGERLQLP